MDTIVVETEPGWDDAVSADDSVKTEAPKKMII